MPMIDPIAELRHHLTPARTRSRREAIPVLHVDRAGVGPAEAARRYADATALLNDGAAQAAQLDAARDREAAREADRRRPARHRWRARGDGAAVDRVGGAVVSAGDLRMPMRKVVTDSMTLVEIMTVMGHMQRVWHFKLACGHSATHLIGDVRRGFRLHVPLPPKSKRCIACPAVRK